MDARLNAPPPSPTAGARRRLLFAALAVVVALAHVLATRAIVETMAALADGDEAMPARIEVAYVRTLEREAPAPAARPARRAVAPAPSEREPRRAKAAASAPDQASAASQAEAASDAAVAAAAESAADAASAPADAVLASADEAASSASAVAAATSSAAAVAAAAAAAASAPAFAVNASAPAGAEPFVWPRATRVRYVLTGNYRGEVNGTAEVEWIRDGPRYQVNVDLVVGPSFAPILQRRATSEGRLTDGGLAPDRYDETSRFMFRDRRHSAVIFWPDSIVLANGQRRERLSGVQDSASQFIQFSWLFGVRPELLRVGNTFDVPLALPRSMDRWTYEVRGEQTLSTAFGPLPTFHLKPRREKVKPGELRVEMWLAPELRFLPVRIRFVQDESTFLDLVISSKPELSG